jgi:hypothetical protein
MKIYLHIMNVEAVTSDVNEVDCPNQADHNNMMIDTMLLNTRLSIQRAKVEVLTFCLHHITKSLLRIQVKGSIIYFLLEFWLINSI